MHRLELARAVYAASHSNGMFTLRSGQTSGEYFDKYLVESDPSLLKELVDHIQGLIPRNTDILAGLEMGGILIATALSAQTKLPVVFVGKHAKELGTRKMAEEGTDLRGKKLCIIEDVVTTGGQIILSATDLRQLGGDVGYAVCVIERDVQARRNLKERGLELMSLFTMDELAEQS